jgi:succinate-semialdehyde dehydrogenase/glutarate-semialdehyde dehydrogenase
MLNNAIVVLGAMMPLSAPFGGVRASGYGREGGAAGIDEFLVTKYVGWGE